jgi:Kdo2-lipid IVA lauroyltransferase/acyltransferase
LKSWLFNIFIVPLLYFISILPFGVLYLLSGVCYLVIFYVIGYRRTVVQTNLRKSFPEKTLAELTHIERRFYLHFCDVIFETIKLLTISKSSFKKRCSMDEPSRRTFEVFFAKNQTIVGVMAHCGNWEWGAIAHQVYFTRMITGVYHPLSNKNFDRFMLNLRGRFGGDIVPMTGLYRRLLELKKQDISTTIGLIADQTPPPESAYWTIFLNQDTPVFNGTEKLARKFNYPVVFLEVKKVKRGHYSLKATTLTEQPTLLPEGAISEMHTRLLEKNIREQPFSWLWSHRRWKHRRRN